jgi:hypothetical protein
MWICISPPVAADGIYLAFLVANTVSFGEVLPTSVALQYAARGQREHTQAAGRRLRNEGLPPQSLGLGRQPPARLKETAACGGGSARPRAQACHTASGWQGGLLVCARAGREGQTAE